MNHLNMYEAYKNFIFRLKSHPQDILLNPYPENFTSLKYNKPKHFIYTNYSIASVF